MSRDLVRLRWLAIVAPLFVLTIVAFLIRGPFHHELHSFPGFVYVLVALAAGVSLFSFVIFALIAALERELVERNRHLAAVLAVAREAGSSLRLADMLDAALDEILAVTTAEAGEVWLLDADELVLERHRGLEHEAFRERERIRIGEGLPGFAAQARSRLVVHDLPSDPRFLRPRVVALGFKSYGAFPLVRRDEIVGVLGVAARPAAALSDPAEHRLLEGIGEQVAVVIENAQLHARVLDAAVLEERERLARELHDGLAQVLGYVNTQALAIKKLLNAGKRQEAEVEVAEMETTARRVYVDVREAILGLRTSTRGLVESVHQYVAGFGRLGDIEVRLDVGDEVEELVLPGSTEIQLVRIVQEALANVRKHARARCARVTIETDGSELFIEISDDGQGFDVEHRRPTGWPHFGLQTMRERTEAIGGRLDVISAPGKGTRVRVRVPAPYLQEVLHARAAR